MIPSITLYVTDTLSKVKLAVHLCPSLRDAVNELAHSDNSTT